MPETFKETEIAGVKYRMKMLGGANAIRCGVLVAGPGLRAVDELLSRADVIAKVIAKVAQAAESKGKDGAPKGGGLDSLTWQDLTALKDAHLPAVIARALESLGGDGVVALGQVFAENTTVWVQGHPQDPTTYPVPMTNRYDEHFAGQFPTFLAWLSWGCWAQGFFDVSKLFQTFTAALSEAKASMSRPSSTGTAGASSPPRT
jgi:hypothetical protein